ncbi:MAG: SRPBCC family protein, partial [Paracoccaceae bacterium]
MQEQPMTDAFAKVENGSTLVIQRWLPGPIERVWRYLTDSELRRKWLASGEMNLAPGASLELVWRNDDLSDPTDHRPNGFAEEQRMQSHIIAVDPMRLLTFSWGHGAVTFELETKGDRVLLTLTHSGLDDGAARNMIAAGWHMHLDILAAESSNQQAASFWSGWKELRDLYASR